MLPASAVPLIAGVLLLIDPEVVMTGAAGDVVSISIGNPTDSADTLPARSVALTVSV